VLATLHTQSASKTVHRMIEVFPAEQQEGIRSLLSDTLRGVIAQRLLKRLDGKGRIAAMEILVGTPACSALIREGKTHQLPTVMQTGRKYGMVYGDDALEELVKGQMVAPEDAFESAEEKERFLPYLKKVPEEYRELLESKAEGARGPRPVAAGR
jgi:twitching motility protein PilT